MTDDMKPIQFRASFPPIQSAIQISGDMEGLRIKLDIPEIDLLQALHMIAKRGQAFIVTIEAIDDATQKDDQIKTTY